jgi:SAM-dependent methyltransferase/thymidine kinase
MSITVLTGPAGSGKSHLLVETVKEALANERKVATFMAKDAMVRSHDPNTWCHGVIASREPGFSCPLDHLVTLEECRAILEGLEPGTLVAFDEARFFDTEVTDAWREASQRGLEVLISTPSKAQLDALGDEPVVKRLTVPCKRCGKNEANSHLVFPGESDATPLCMDCRREVTLEARAEIIARLKAQAPYPGEEVLYQPVELEECESWRVLRVDTEKRVEIMKQVIAQVAETDGTRPLSYIDLGCNTGYFCNKMAKFGLASLGVDLVRDDIEVARMLTTFIRGDEARYVVADIHEYLRDTRDEPIDVTSAFSVVQWLIIQKKSLKFGQEALAWLFEKTGRICFLEMGYASEGIYKDQLPELIDRAWVMRTMEQSEMFEDIRCYDAKEHGLMRDLFVGFKRVRTSLSSPDAQARADELSSLAEFADERELVERLSPLLERLLKSKSAGRYFRLLEERGIHLTPVGRHEPIPNTRALPSQLWEKKKELPGIDLNVETQLSLVTEAFPKFRDEYEAIPRSEPAEPGRFSLANRSLTGTDALAYYCMIRHFSPSRIIEVGSGPSTLLAAEAAKRNGSTSVTAIDPNASDSIAELPGVSIERQPVEELEVTYFDRLEANDILFIDSSHVTRIGGDVNFLFLEVLPRLKPGVLVQVHDVFLPVEYSKDWVLERRRFWNEQYLVQAFLVFNTEWEVLIANNYLGRSHREEMKKTFPNSPWWGGGSFWMRRKPE